MSSAQRVLFIIMGIVISLGIYLSGYESVHWVLYVPAIALTFAGISGFCLGLFLLKKIGLN